MKILPSPFIDGELRIIQVFQGIGVNWNKVKFYMESRSGTVQQKQLKLDNDQWELSTHHKHNHQTNVPKRLVQEEHRLGKFQ